MNIFFFAEAFVIPATHRILATILNQNDPANLNSLQLAIDATGSERYSLRAAARLYKVSYSWLQRRCSDPQCYIKQSVRPPALSSKEEELLVKAFLHLRENHTPLSLEGLKNLIELFVSLFLLINAVVYRSETIVPESLLFSFSSAVTAHNFACGGRQIWNAQVLSQ